MSHYPDFLIIGAAKAGTTSLVEYLKQHPDIYFSPIKEPHFFSTDIRPEHFNKRYYENIVMDLERYFDQKSLKEIFEAYVRDKKQYLQLFEDAKPDQVKGEASTTYLYSKEAAENIRKTIPGAKIIAILRNPLERAFSHYQMALKFGFTALPFLEAIKEDQAKAEKGWGISELFLESGLYYEALKRYFDRFPRDQIQVIFQEHLSRETEGTLQQLTEFLNVADFSFDTGLTHNKAGIPRFRVINEALNKMGLRMKLAKLLPTPLKERLKSLYLKKPNHSIDDEPEAKQFLLDFYQEDIRKTEKLLNTDLSHWLN